MKTMKNKALRVTAVAVMLAICITVFAACGNPAGKLAGRWSKTSGGTSINKLEFFSDGTYKSDYSNYYGSFSVDGNRIRLSGVLVEDLTMNFEVNGDNLIFYSDNENKEIMKFERNK